MFAKQNVNYENCYVRVTVEESEDKKVNKNQV